MTPLRQRMREDMQLRDFAPKTQDVYIHAVQQFASYYHKSPEQVHVKPLAKLFRGKMRAGLRQRRIILFHWRRTPLNSLLLRASVTTRNGSI